MATVVFYEKPNCTNNSRQKQLLTEAGHTVIAKNLLTTAWDEGSLGLFLATHAVVEWFNPSAPQIKSGAVQPQQLTAEQALKLLLADPILIRRPLIQIDERYYLGFNQISAEMGLNTMTTENVEICNRKHNCN